jgi:hypothetical protein
MSASVVSWRLDRDEMELRVEVPAGTSAEVVLPDGGYGAGRPGAHQFRRTIGRAVRDFRLTRRAVKQVRPRSGRQRARR